jgi:hypothetical protein
MEGIYRLPRSWPCLSLTVRTILLAMVGPEV